MEGIIDVRLYDLIMEVIGFDLVDDAIQVWPESIYDLVLKNQEDVNFLRLLASVSLMTYLMLWTSILRRLHCNWQLKSVSS